MSDTAEQLENMDSKWTEELDSVSDLWSCKVQVSTAGDQSASYRTENDPKSPYQRLIWVERKEPLEVRCTCLDVVHGFMGKPMFIATDAEGDDTDDEPELATLIVLEFHLDSDTETMRIRSANISIQFSALSSDEADPVVQKIAPEGPYIMMETVEKHAFDTMRITCRLVLKSLC